jgi:hypothetical protein
VNQARGLGCLAWLMAQSPLKDQAWKAASGTISLVSGEGADRRFRLSAAPLDMSSARMVWEAGGIDPVFSSDFAFRPELARARWVEAEAQFPDGRRVFAETNFPPSLR